MCVLQCWSKLPADRPTFAALVKSFGDVLEEAKKGSPPARDIGEMLNAKLTEDIRRLSIYRKKKSVVPCGFF